MFQVNVFGEGSLDFCPFAAGAQRQTKSRMDESSPAASEESGASFPPEPFCSELAANFEANGFHFLFTAG